MAVINSEPVSLHMCASATSPGVATAATAAAAAAAAASSAAFFAAAALAARFRLTDAPRVPIPSVSRTSPYSFDAPVPCGALTAPESPALAATVSLLSPPPSPPPTQLPVSATTSCPSSFRMCRCRAVIQASAHRA
ncbi:hypothetical protein Vafri_20262 [Volvox africanus]|uniref:Uncharacterized protein n=1 Tax=Volvox africanus TaxID=51714 RepID=A0A8J4BS04_9CHLO|nr:hypothetical protein Vafri_20262 [Volvox africanus]